MPDNNSVIRFINSYNALALKPAPDYTMKIMPGIAGTLLAGFSYKGSRNIVTIPLFFGQSVVSSDRSDAPKSPDWKTLNFSYFGTGIGYMGYIFTKTLGKSYRFPKLEYQVSLNAESDSFLYKEESGKNDKQNFFSPSTTVFLQYNLYPPAEISERRIGFGLNLKYHTTLTSSNLSALQQDFQYNYTGSLRKNISTVSAGISIIFLGSLAEKKKFRETKPFKITIIDTGTNRPVTGTIIVHNSETDRKLKPSHGVYHLKKKDGGFPGVRVKARAKGFFSNTDVVTPIESDPGDYKIFLNRIHPEKSLAIVHFQHATTSMTDNSSVVLEKVAETLKENPAIRIIIKGYTSSEGSARKNIKLSRARARFVEAFFINRNIANHRMQTEGLGSADRIFPEDTEEHRAYNRRVEIFVLQ